MDAVRQTFPLSTPGLKAAAQQRPWLWPVAMSLLLMVITSIPYLYGFWNTPQDQVFSGIVYNVHDTAQYLSWMREAKSALFIENRLTSEPNPAIFFNLHWWLPGRLAGLLGLSPMQIYHLYRLAAIPFCVTVIYWLAGLVLPDRRQQLYAFGLTIVGSGLGWIWVVHKYAAGLPDVLYPTDIYTAPGNTFYTFMVSPHLTLSLGLTLWAIGLAFQAHRRQSWGYALAAGLVALILGFGHIYDLVTVWSALGAFGLVILLRNGVRQTLKSFFLLSGVVALSLPAAAYFAHVSSNANPIWQQALDQYDNLNAFTPDPAHLLILLGLPLMISIITFRGFVPLREKDELYLFIATWFLANMLIIYLPLKFRIMLLAGLQFPLAVLTTIALFRYIIPWLAEQRLKLGQVTLSFGPLARTWLPVLLLAAVLPANLYIFGWRMLDMYRHDYPFFLYQDDLAAFEWLESNADREAVVLTSFTIGHYLPGLTGVRPFLSNAVMTVNFVEKEAQVRRFFTAETGEVDRCAFLTDNHIDYLFYGEAERAVGDFDPAGNPNFNPVFTSDRTAVYAVNCQ